MARLVLDPMCVLSAWEEMGGSAFASDDLSLDDPAAFSLDLSSWEARNKPLSAPCLGTGIFPPLFPASGVGIGSVPGFSPAASTGASPVDSAQVVPLCPTTSAVSLGSDPLGSVRGMDDIDDVAAFADGGMLDDVAECGPLSEVDALPLHFPGMEPLLSPSPTTSEAGVVPDLTGCGQPFARRSVGSTSTSGVDGPSCSSAPFVAGAQRPFPAPQGSPSIPQLPAGLFVPVDQPGFPSTGGGYALLGAKPEPIEEGCQGPVAAASPTVPPQPTVPTSEHKARSAAQQARGSTASTAAASGAQTAGVHVRTRAECLERYREKKARRLYTKKIRYQLRKINADKRPRIKGRFVKKEELAEFLATQQTASALPGSDDGDMYGAAMDSDYE